MSDAPGAPQMPVITAESDERENAGPAFDGSDWQGAQSIDSRAVESNTKSNPNRHRLPPRWKPGTSGNPGGRKPVPDDVKQLARTFTQGALRRLAALAGLSSDEGKLVKPAGTPAVQLGAAVALLDRAWGRPESSLAVTTPDGPSLGLDREMTTMLLDLLRERQATPVTATRLPDESADSHEKP